MSSILKKIFIFHCFFLLSNLWGQSNLLNIHGEITEHDEPAESAVVTVYSGSKVVQTQVTTAEGRYQLDLPLNVDYTIVISKQGLMSKKFFVSTKGIPPEKMTEPFNPVEASVDLFEKVEGVDYAILNQPLNKCFYNQDENKFQYDIEYKNQMLDALAQLDKAMEEALKKQKDLEKNYMAQLKAGEKFYGKREWDAAIASYKQAQTLKPNEPLPKEKIAEIERLKATEAELAKKNSDEAAALAAKKKAEEEAALAAKKKSEEEAALAAKKKAEEEAALAAKKKSEEVAALAAKKKAEEEAALAAKKKAEEEAALAAKKKAEEEAALAAKKKAEEEAALAAKKKSEEEAALAAKKKAEEEAAHAAKKKAEEEAALAAKKKAEDEATLAAKKKAEEESALAAKKKAEEEAAIAAKKKAEEEATLAAKKKAEEEAALAAKKKAEEEAVLAAKKKAEDEATLAAKKKSEEEAALAAKKKAEEGKELKYSSAVVKGDNNMKQKNYAEAKAAYSEALGVKPGDAVAKNKLVEAERLLKSDENTAKAPTTEIAHAEKQPHPLTLKYPQGITEETVSERGVYIIRRIVVKDKDAWVYTKKIFNWGGVVFLKDNVPITESIYENETK